MTQIMIVDFSGKGGRKKLKFKGVKHIKYIGPEIKKAKPTIKDFWRKLFGDYAFPICPLCKEDMLCESMEIQKQVTIFYTLGVHNPSSFPTGLTEINVNFKCPKCGSEMEGIGIGVTFSSEDWFSLEEFHVTRIRMEMKQ